MNASQLPQPGHGDRGVGQLELHRLELRERLAELHPVADVLHGQLDRTLEGAEHAPRRPGSAAAARSGGGRRPRRRRSAPGPRRTAPSRVPSGRCPPRRRPHRRRASVPDPPLREQVAVVDPPDPLGHDDRRPAVGVADQRGSERVRQRHPPGRVAQRRGRGERDVAVARLEVVDAELGQQRRHLGWRAPSDPPRPRRATSTPPSAAKALDAACAQVPGLVGQRRVHTRPPASRALATIMRCTSIVPLATVAAWA